MRPSPARSSGASSADGIWSVAASLPAGSTVLSCRLFSDGLLAALRRTDGQRPRPHPLAEPEGIEQAVEPVPLGFPRREQMLERRAQQAGLFGIAGRHQGSRILALVQADGKTVVAQGFEKCRKFARDEAGDLVDLIICRSRCRNNSCHLPQ